MRHRHPLPPEPGQHPRQHQRAHDARQPTRHHRDRQPAQPPPQCVRHGQLDDRVAEHRRDHVGPSGHLDVDQVRALDGLPAPHETQALHDRTHDRTHARPVPRRPAAPRRSAGRSGPATSMSSRARREAPSPDVTSSRTRQELRPARAKARPARARRRRAGAKTKRPALNGRQIGRCAPRTAASMADHYHSASEHGIIGRRIETIVVGRFRRGTPRIVACGVSEGVVSRSGTVPCRGAVRAAARKGMGEWRR
jgi:hypothetical protein